MLHLNFFDGRLLPRHAAWQGHLGPFFSERARVFGALEDVRNRAVSKSLATVVSASEHRNQVGSVATD
jgi:hypothetical protein